MIQQQHIISAPRSCFQHSCRKLLRIGGPWRIPLFIMEQKGSWIHFAWWAKLSWLSLKSSKGLDWQLLTTPMLASCQHSRYVKHSQNLRVQRLFSHYYVAYNSKRITVNATKLKMWPFGFLIKLRWHRGLTGRTELGKKQDLSIGTTTQHAGKCAFLHHGRRMQPEEWEGLKLLLAD